MCMSPQAVGVEPDGMPLGRFLPLALGVTAAVTALPLLAVSQLGPARSVPALALHVIAAVALSVLLARLLAALWKRHRQSSDLVFGDLLIWGWTRRALAERRLEAATREIEAPAAGDESRVTLLRRMNALLEARDPYTHGHSRRVARHAERIAREIGLPVEQVDKIRAAALVHDIGKVNVPRSILNKSDQLTDDEYSLVKRHAADGAVLVSALDDPGLTAIVRHHHERMDGTGYPDGLAGGDIPIGARVIAVADTFDAITSTRAYRKPRTHDQALQILQQEAGIQLDATAVAAFVSYYAARRSVGLVSMLAAAPQRLLTGLAGAQSGVAAGVAPLAQTACGVGGVALIGACLGGPALQASTTSVVHKGAHRQFAAQSSRSGDYARPTGESRRESGGSHGQGRVAAPGGRDQSSSAPPVQGTEPRPLKTPVTDAPSDGQPPSGGGGGGGGSSGEGVTLPTVPSTTPSLPSLPDAQTLLTPVTDNLSPPQVNLPAPLPPVGLP
jgi:putative nucleotidyltransferase with HDIG domain